MKTCKRGRSTRGEKQRQHCLNAICQSINYSYGTVSRAPLQSHSRTFRIRAHTQINVRWNTHLRLFSAKMHTFSHSQEVTSVQPPASVLRTGCCRGLNVEHSLHITSYITITHWHNQWTQQRRYTQTKGWIKETCLLK